VIIEEFLELISSNISIAVLIQGLESFVLVKQRSSAQLLSNGLRSSEVANDNLQSLLQQVDGLVSEDLVQGNIVSIGRSSSAQDLSIAGILGGQDFTEGGESQSTFVVLVVLLQQEGDLIISWEDSELIEGVLDLSSANDGLSFNIKELEGIQEVEISSDSKVNLSVLQFLIKSNLAVKGIGEVFLFMTLHWGKSSSWASGPQWAGNSSSWGSDSGSAKGGGIELSFEISSGNRLSVWAGNLLGGFGTDSGSSEVVASSKWGSRTSRGVDVVDVVEVGELFGGLGSIGGGSELGGALASQGRSNSSSGGSDSSGWGGNSSGSMEGVLGGDGVVELREAELAIVVSVSTTEESKDFGFSGSDTIFLEEGIDGVNINGAESVNVNNLEEVKGIEVVTISEVLSESFSLGG